MSCLRSSEKLRGRLSHGWSGSSAASPRSLQALILLSFVCPLTATSSQTGCPSLRYHIPFHGKKEEGDRQIKQSFLLRFPNREQDLSQKRPFNFLFSVICLNCFTRLPPPTGKTREVSVWLGGMG